MDQELCLRSEGKTYCEYESPSPESLLEHARVLNISAEKITCVQMEIHPGMFRKKADSGSGTIK
jgi:hypothetical protein